MRHVNRARHGAWAVAALAVALAFLAACQTPPRPFAPTERGGSASFRPAEDAYGIALRPVSGMPSALAASFVPALVEALGRRGVPAAVSSNRGSGALAYGGAEARPLHGDRLKVGIEWWVIGSDGRGLGRHWVSAEPSRRDWEVAAPALAERLAAESADGIAGLLRPVAQALARAPPAVRVGAVAAPPGIDGETLRHATIDAMRAARIEIVPDGRAGPRLTATVSLGPVTAGRRRLRVDWRLDDASGARLGSMVQENEVVNETLIAEWPRLVRLIARAATDELADLLTRARGNAASRPVDGPSRHP